MNETELAAAVAAGAVPSPAKCAGFWLVALRITGTGTSYRSALDEHVYRPPENYLTPDFLPRCNGLPVIANHQPGVLDSAEYEARTLGSIVLPYIANADGIEDPTGNEVWGVARVYSDEVVQALSDPNNPLSTSPCVIFRPADGNEKLELPDGSIILIEGTPSLLCSLAICNGQGVWDKGLPADGIRVDSQLGVLNMTEDETAAEQARKAAEEKARKDAETATNIDKILQHLNDGAKKMDALCSRLDALENGGRKQELLEVDGKKTDKELDRERDEGYLNADAQARADSVYQAWGARAPLPMQSEKPINYRRRLLRPMQRHSTEFKDSNLEVLASDPKTFDAIEGRIYADALVASRNPKHPEGHIEKRTRTDPESGHRITEFFGSPTIFKSFSPPAKLATRFLIPALVGDNR